MRDETRTDPDCPVHGGFPARVSAIIDRLSERIDTQAMRPGADAPHIVSLVGTFHRAAGDLERELERPVVRAKLPTAVASVMFSLRVLHRIVDSHATMLRLAALRAKARP